MNSADVASSEQQTNQIDWERMASRREFQDLLALKKAFILPAFVIFFFYYFALPIAVGFAPKWMSVEVIGKVNLGYLFALSQFVVGGIIAWLYLVAAAKFDALTADLLKKEGNSSKEGR